MATFAKKGDIIFGFQFAESLHTWTEDYGNTIDEHLNYSVQENDLVELIYTFQAHIHYWFTHEASELSEKIVLALNNEGFYDDFYPLYNQVPSPGLYEIVEEIEGIVYAYDQQSLNLVLEDGAELFIDLKEDDMCIKDRIEDEEIEAGDKFIHREYCTWYFMNQQTKEEIVEEYKGYIQMLNNIYSEKGYSKKIKIGL